MIHKAYRASVAGLAVGATAFVGIAINEGYRGTAYTPVPNDVATIGFGTTKGVRIGDTITPTAALVRALGDVKEAADAVKRCVKVDLYPHEFDAYVSLTYNIGQGAFCKSTLVKELNAGRYEEACKQVLRWDHFKGKPLTGLTKRRREEYNTCIGGTI